MQDNGYGASQEKIFQNSQGVLTWYVWGGDAVIAEYTSAGWGGAYTWAKSYVYAGSRLLSTFANNSAGGEVLEFHHPDRLGTRMVTNPAADTLYLQSTLPFGTLLSSETTGSSNRLFTSYDRSSSTGMDYAVNRTYSSGQGRFTTPDPIGMASVSIGNPQSFNLYAYVQNNPIDFVDPSGLFRFKPRPQPEPELDLDALSKFIQDSFDFVRIEENGIPDSPTDGGGGTVSTSQNRPKFALSDLVDAAAKVIANATEKCAELLGKNAVEHFSEIRDNIEFNKDIFSSGLTNAETVGDAIFLNPKGFAFSDFKLSGVAGSAAAKAAEKLNRKVEKQLSLAATQFDYAVAVVIHEFLHVIGRFMPDGNQFDTSQSEANQKKVLKSCFPKPKS